MRIPPAVSASLAKINFTSLALALILFLFPWTRITCNGRDVATQNGVQVIYAGVSPAAEFKDDMAAMGEDGPKRGSSDAGEKNPANDIGYGLITLLIFLLVAAGAALAGMLVFKKQPPAVSPAALATVALALLLFQCLIGFPIDRTVNRAKSEMGSGGGNAEERAFAQAAQSAVTVQSSRTGWFYIELLALAVPAGLMIYSRLPDRAVVGEQPGAGPTPPPESQV